MLFKFNRRSSWSKFFFALILVVIYFVYQNYWASKTTALISEKTIATALPLVVTAAPSTNIKIATASADNLEPASVSKVVDGDTIQLSDGRKVRYIGIDTPETVHPTKAIGCYGQEASAKNKELVLNKIVALEKDVSETDRYGRLLRYVYLDGIMVNDLLVKAGYARVSTYPPDVKYQAIFSASEKIAQEQNLGLWGEKCAITTIDLTR